MYVTLYKLENISTSVISLEISDYLTYMNKSVNEERLHLPVPITGREAEPSSSEVSY